MSIFRDEAIQAQREVKPFQHFAGCRQKLSLLQEVTPKFSCIISFGWNSCVLRFSLIHALKQPIWGFAPPETLTHPKLKMNN